MAGLSILVFIPEAFTTIVWATLGLGLLLIIAPNLLLWIALGLPLHRILGLLGFLLVPVILIAPGFIAQKKVNSALADAVGNDFSQTLPQNPIALRIISEGFGYNTASLRCDDLCQYLFSQAGVTHLEYVNISNDMRVEKSRTRRVTYRLQNSKNCKTDLVFKGDIKLELLDMIAKGKCVEKSENIPPKNNIFTVHHKNEGVQTIKNLNSAGSIFFRYKRLAQIEVTNKTGTRLVQKTDWHLEALAMPFVFVPNEIDGHNVMVGPLRKQHTTMKEPFSEWVAMTLYPNFPGVNSSSRRLSIAERNSGKQERDTANSDYNRALIILNANNNEIIDGQQLLILEQAVQSLRRVATGREARIAFELRLLADARIQDDKFLFQRVVQLVGMPNHKDKEAMPLLWARFKAAKQAGKPVDEILYWISRVDPKYQKAYGQEIMREISKVEISKSHRMFGNLGKFTKSPKPLFRNGLDWNLDNYNHVHSSTLYAICNSDPKWRGELAPLLTDYIRKAETRKGWQENLAKAIKTLETWEMAADITQPYRQGQSRKRDPREFLKKFDKRPWRCRG